MNNEDYQLEEMENSAVNKSAMAKRAAAGAGLLAAGAATAYGAEQLVNGDEPAAEPTTVEQPDLTSGATAGAVEEGVAEQPQAQPEPQPQVVRTEERVDVYVHPDPQPQPEPEPEMEVNTTTNMYDEEGHLVGSIDAGTYGDKSFAVVDKDGDGRADVLWYDEDGDGKISEGETVDVSDSNYIMGKGAAVVNVTVPSGSAPEPDPYYDPLADIRNDFQDEKSGEEYTGDLAQNNPDYNNNGNVDQYRAGGETSSEEPVLEEEPIYDGTPAVEPEEEPLIAEDYTEKYDASPNEDSLLAEDDTLLEEDSTEDYALSEEEPTEDTSSENEMAYNDDEIENDIDDTADEDLAYNDEADSDMNDSVDDTEQYDIV